MALVEQWMLLVLLAVRYHYLAARFPHLAVRLSLWLLCMDICTCVIRDSV